MKDEELEQAFNESQQKWLEANKGTGYSTMQHRYFFFAGATFGTQATQKIHDESFQESIAQSEGAK